MPACTALESTLIPTGIQPSDSSTPRFSSSDFICAAQKSVLLSGMPAYVYGKAQLDEVMP